MFNLPSCVCEALGPLCSEESPCCLFDVGQICLYFVAIRFDPVLITMTIVLVEKAFEFIRNGN